MSTLGAVVLAGTAPRTARTLDSLVRQARRIDAVAIVVPADLDPRVREWLGALAGARGWALVVTPDAPSDSPPGARIAAGLAAARTDWLVLLEAGETLTHGAATALDTAMATAQPAASCIVGAVRLVALGVEETMRVAAPVDVSTLDPAHPCLRSLCWRREAIDAAGGFDRDVPAAARYELWLRLTAAGHETAVSNHTLVQLSVEPGEPIPAELGMDGYLDAVRAVLIRHAAPLAARVGEVLEARARRVASLGPRHLRSLERNRGAQADVDAADQSAPALMGWLAARASPLSREWGYDRGGPLDRVYIEQFIESHASDIRGAVLEVQEADYTRRFGGASVERSDVVDLAESNADATVVTDLRAAANIADATYDCVILTQTLHVIAPMHEAVLECFRILKPGGVLLVTMPCASRVCLEYGRDGDFWRVTPAGARALFEPVFGDRVSVEAYGNAGAGAAFLFGVGASEVDPRVLAGTDIFNPTLVGVRAAKPGGRSESPAIVAGRQDHGLVLLYHRVGGVGPDPHHINARADVFERHLQWLSSECAVLGLTELVEGAGHSRLPPRAIAITFDDGYLDTLTTAAPMLRARKLPATCFVATADLDDAHVFWWDRLAAVLLGEGSRPGSLSIELPEGPTTWQTTSAGDRLFAHQCIYHAIVALPSPARRRVLSQLDAWAPGARSDEACRRMNGEQLRALSGHGVAIGAHTVHHPQLPTLDYAAQVREIADSRAALERVSGAPVTQLAYPFGAFDDTTAAAAVEAGMTGAFTCEPRILSASDSRHRLPRLDPQESSPERFAARVRMAFGAGW